MNKNNSARMLTPERLALILLAILLLAWGGILMYNRHHVKSAPKEPVRTEMQISDGKNGMDGKNGRNEKKERKEKNGTDRKSQKKSGKTKEQQPVRQRDHLNEEI